MKCPTHGDYAEPLECPVCREERNVRADADRVTGDADRDRFCGLALDRVSGKRIEHWHSGPRGTSYVLTFLPRSEHRAQPVSVELAEGDLRMLAALLGRYL
jgi:hypothetical protein